MVKSKKGLSFEELARRNARWTGIPQVRSQQEAEDSQEQLDALSEPEKRDNRKFREGKMVICAFTRRIQEEEQEEQLAAQYR